MSNDRSRTDLESDFALVARLASVEGSGVIGQTTLLHVGNEHLVVLNGQGNQAGTEQRLDLGVARITRDFVHQDPPTSREIEQAIDFSEDEIMRLGRQADVRSTLWSTSAALLVWSAVSGPRIAIETVEQWFQQLAAAALGQPAAMRGLPSGREAAATLLVLREFMHHRGHATIVVVEPRQHTLVAKSASA